MPRNVNPASIANMIKSNTLIWCEDRPEPGRAVGFALVQTPSVVGLDESSPGISNLPQYTNFPWTRKEQNRKFYTAVLARGELLVFFPVSDRMAVRI